MDKKNRQRQGRPKKVDNSYGCCIISAMIIACGCIFMVGIYLTLLAHGNESNPGVESKLSSALKLNPLRGDEEAKPGNVSLRERKDIQFRRSTIHPDSIVWPTLTTGDLTGYPIYDSLYNVIANWNPDQPDPPSMFQESLQHFNYSDPDERALAAIFRDAEIPFKLYNIPPLDRVIEKWTDGFVDPLTENCLIDDLVRYLIENLNMRGANHVERSKNNHFMYWTMNGARGMSQNFVPPTTIVKDLTFQRWLQLAHDADESRLESEVEHFYFMSNAPPRDNGRTFISRDLDFFSTRKENFFITNVAANKGIQCRFSMRGIISESHYDTGKNMVAMFRGAKRYILTPPSTCENLEIITDPSHPSYRHSAIDWSDINVARAKFKDVAAIDTIVHMGEILYIPSFWFHYIVSLRYSIQCNSRSGTPPSHDGKKHIEECLDLKLDFTR